MVCALVPGVELQVAADSTDARSYRVDFSKLTAALPGFSAEHRPDEAVRAMRSAMWAAGMTAEDFQGRRYVRLAQIRHLVGQGQLDVALRWRRG